MSKKIFCFDLDNTLCTTYRSEYGKSKPKKKAINKVNQLFEKGHIIKIYTARYMGRYNNNRFLAEKKIKKLTITHLKKWGLKYHKIYFGKPSFDLVIDDKAIFFKKNWRDYIKKICD